MTRRLQPVMALLLGCVAANGCETAASIDVLGSYFPAWLLCSVVALILTVLIHRALTRLRIELAAPAVAYPAMVAALTCAQWLLFLR